MPRKGTGIKRFQETWKKVLQVAVCVKAEIHTKMGARHEMMLWKRGKGKGAKAKRIVLGYAVLRNTIMHLHRGSGELCKAGPPFRFTSVAHPRVQDGGDLYAGASAFIWPMTTRPSAP